MAYKQISELINRISGKNRVAQELLNKVAIITPNYATVVVMTLQKYNVTGNNIERMYVTCCKKNMGEFLMAVNRFLEEKYTADQIHETIKNGKPFEV